LLQQVLDRLDATASTPNHDALIEALAIYIVQLTVCPLEMPTHTLVVEVGYLRVRFVNDRSLAIPLVEAEEAILVEYVIIIVFVKILFVIAQR
jgi:hypothetical protein